MSLHRGHSVPNPSEPPGHHPKTRCHVECSASGRCPWSILGWSCPPGPSRDKQELQGKLPISPSRPSTPALTLLPSLHFPPKSRNETYLQHRVGPDEFLQNTFLLAANPKIKQSRGSHKHPEPSQPKASFTISVSCSIYKPREITTMRITTKMKTKGTSLTIQCYGSSTKGKAENEFLKERIKATCPELISSFPPTSDSG